MAPKEVLVIGGGISGCAAALAVAKKGIPVSILTSSQDQRVYHSSFIPPDGIQNHLIALRAVDRGVGCGRAAERLLHFVEKSVVELLDLDLLAEIPVNFDVHECLKRQLKEIPHVEWITGHSVIDLLTIENHSLRKSDAYKKPTCLGVYAYNEETARVEAFLAKETILATGGASSLFPHSTNVWSAQGAGLAMARRAGARLLNLGQISFHPISLYAHDKPCVPLPIDLLRQGGRLYSAANRLLEEVCPDENLSKRLYEELLNENSTHLWLDLTMLDPVKMNEEHPMLEKWCLNYGFNAVKDPIPVVPAAQYTQGGISVDPVCQTTVNRLRAIGEVACTGLFYGASEESTGILESLTWAVACADDIAKHISKFIYYFPAIREWNRPIDSFFSPIKEDWRMMQQIMWYYVGVVHDVRRLRRGRALLSELVTQHADEGRRLFSIGGACLNNALEAALMITESSLGSVQE
jgi:L-aspartate oxidase